MSKYALLLYATAAIVLLTQATFGAETSERSSLFEDIDRRVSSADFTGAVLVSRGTTTVLNKGEKYFGAEDPIRVILVAGNVE